MAEFLEPSSPPYETIVDVDCVRLDAVEVTCLGKLFGTMGLVMLKPNFVDCRGFSEALAPDNGETLELFFGEIAHWQVKCQFHDSVECASIKNRLFELLHDPDNLFSAGVILPSPKPWILASGKATLAVSAFVDLLQHVNIDCVTLARHGQKIPLIHFPALFWLASKPNRVAHIGIDLAWSWKPLNDGVPGVPIFNAPWASYPNMWMFCQRIGSLVLKVVTVTGHSH
jgi:hypothetical protein